MAVLKHFSIFLTDCFTSNCVPVFEYLPPEAATCGSLKCGLLFFILVQLFHSHLLDGIELTRTELLI